MAGTLDHALNASLAAALDQLPQDDKFLYLRSVGGVGHASRAEAISKAEGELVLVSQFQKVIEVLVEGVLHLVVEYPGGEERTAAGDDVRKAPGAPQA